MTSDKDRKNKSAWTIWFKYSGLPTDGGLIDPGTYVKIMEYPVLEVGTTVVDCVRAFVSYTNSADWKKKASRGVEPRDMLWVGGKLFNNGKSRLFAVLDGLAVECLNPDFTKAFADAFAIGD